MGCIQLQLLVERVPTAKLVPIADGDVPDAAVAVSVAGGAVPEISELIL
jgi:hypothetical protein